MGDGNHLLHVQDARNIVYLVHGGGVATIFYPVQGWRGGGRQRGGNIVFSFCMYRG